MNTRLHAFLLVGVLTALPFAAAAQWVPIHRYSFNNAAGDATGATVTDSIGGAEGLVQGAGATFDGNQLVLPGGSSATQAYVDLPNGLISGLVDLTFEIWLTVDGASLWARAYDFGTGDQGEITGPGGSAGGTDYFGFMPQRGLDTDAQRIDVWSSESGHDSLDIDLAQTLGVQYHYVVTYENTGGGGEVGVYRDGEVVLEPKAVATELSEIEDVNNWLGRSNWTGDGNFHGRINEFRIYNFVMGPRLIFESFEMGPDMIFDEVLEDGFESEE